MAKNKWDIDPKEVVGRVQSDWRGTWLVLRCAPQSTLRLVAALSDIKARVWTPMWWRRRRHPRTHYARDLLLPCLPSFLFLAEEDLDLVLSAKDQFGVPAFRLMDQYGVFVRVKDEELEGLRKVADLSPRKKNPIKWPEIGSEQKVVSGAFQGMTGKVVSRTRRHCMVELGEKNSFLVKIPPFLLQRAGGDLATVNGGDPDHTALQAPGS